MYGNEAEATPQPVLILESERNVVTTKCGDSCNGSETELE
jgi:hypothetical protein